MRLRKLCIIVETHRVIAGSGDDILGSKNKIEISSVLSRKL